MGTSIRLLVNFSTETLPARKDWDDIVKVPKEKKYANQEYWAWQSHPSEMTFSDKQKLRAFITTIPSL